MQLPKGGRARKEFWAGRTEQKEALKIQNLAWRDFSPASNGRYQEKIDFLVSIRQEIQPKLDVLRKGEEWCS